LSNAGEVGALGFASLVVHSPVVHAKFSCYMLVDYIVQLYTDSVVVSVTILTNINTICRVVMQMYLLAGADLDI